MAISTDTRNRLKYGLANNVAGDEVADAINAGGGALANTHILVGNAGGVATDVALSGDATMANTGALSITAQKMDSSSNAYIKTDSGTKTLLASATSDRRVMIAVNVTTVFANGDGGQPTVSIGQTSSVSKFAATSIFTSAAAGATFSFGGTLTGGTALLATLVAGSGTTETGAYTVTAIAVG